MADAAEAPATAPAAEASAATGENVSLETVYDIPFEAGKAALERQWPYAYALGLESSIKGKFKITTLPGWKDNPGGGVIGGYNLAINAYSKNPDTALAFADFVTQPLKLDVINVRRFRCVRAIREHAAVHALIKSLPAGL